MPLTAPQLQALSAEISNDPESMGYATPLSNGKHNAVADLLNSDDPTGATVFTPIPVRELHHVIATEGGRAAIENAAEDDTHNAQGPALVVRDFFGLPPEEFVPAQYQAIRDLFVTLQQEGVLPQATINALVDESERPARRVEVVLEQGVRVTHHDVSDALN